ncbi:GTN reductase [Oceaniovalibus guishaninsula JLT2003]|uniref:GTN reductase n=1 Tax=Oceaniovalibus guishaninsula JLT2003 TaxID=1231392 RepID=K2HJQ4_9RHOB|nr:alkene reductase [Oceaniovalibus guishaninsula]EKE43229.1 GTN reductase [Oceaniovalibus guishaninsula JLT2003]
MTDTSILFDPLKAGDLTLPNRVLMAPLTRNRAHADGTPKEIAATYYAQRASAGLIITEATQISPMGKGYIDTPGIHTQKQADAWARIVDAVHAAGGRIALQLWHVGRISHVSLLPGGAQPLSSSAVRADSKTFTANGFEDCSDPVAMTADQIARTIDDYATAARFARDAGFDGVEVHGANGYLLDQFLQDGVNRRDDDYGGSVENRMRLLSQVLDRVTDVFGASRVGVRLSPLGQANDISDSDPETLFAGVIDMLSPRGLAYLHFVEGFTGVDDTSQDDRAMLRRLRSRFEGTYFGNGGYDARAAAQAIREGRADAIAFGRPFIANPDLPERFRIGAALNEQDRDTFYGGGEKGYTDYPFLTEDDVRKAG